MFTVLRSGSCITLQGPEGKYSFYDPHCVFTGMGWDTETASALLCCQAPRTALLLGLGGGTVARQLQRLFPRISIVGVEIDPHVVDAAMRHFRDAIGRATVTVDNGEQFVRRTRQRFDFVLDDMWDHERQRPRAILSDSAWPGILRKRLTRTGIAAINLYSRQERPEDFAFAVERMKTCFKSVAEVRLPCERVSVIAGARHAVSPQEARRRISLLPKEDRSHLAAVEFALC